MSILPAVEWSAMDVAARRAWVDGLRPPAPDADVAPILAAVRERGDAALRELTRQHDGPDLADPWLDREAWEAARVDPGLEAALEAAAAAIRRYHADQRNALRAERPVRTGGGVTAWRRWQPIERIGCYVPGGRAAYASSVLMLAVPARLAGVEEVIVATPPDREGRVADAIIAAARIGGVDRILRAGGAQAIAAMAYGTGTVPAVDKLFGAGNAWVTAAKRAVSGSVAVDLPAGPSECVLVVDAGADPELVALDLLAQAEHGPDSIAIVVSTDGDLLRAVDAALPVSATGLATGEAALATLRRHGAAVLAASHDDAIAAVNEIAAEHVSLQCAAAEGAVAAIRNAGAVFVGPWSAIAAGDYATGTNHVLPTGRAARAWSGVGVEAFGRWIELQRVSPAGARRLAPIVEAIAHAEGLPAHAASVVARAARAAVDGPPDDPVELLRRPGPVSAYPAEPSDEELAVRGGVGVARIVRADMNTLGGGALGAVAAGVAGLDADRLPEYGDLAYRRLRAALGSRHGVDPRRIVPGAGADELIRLVTTLAAGDGDAVMVPTPTFAMFAVEARLAGARVVDLPRTDLACPLPAHVVRAAAEEHAARLVWLCSPNNPTGDLVPLDDVRAIADGLPAIVCVDEVYLDFAEDAAGAAPGSLSAITMQEELPNVLVLRSLSKSHGLASARVGYLIVPSSLAGRLDAVRLPLSVSATSEALALAAVAADDEARVRRAETLAARARLATLLGALGCDVLPGVANFVSFRPARDPAAVDEALLARGIAVRRYESGPMAGWLRATARIGDEEERVAVSMREVLA